MGVSTSRNVQAKKQPAYLLDTLHGHSGGINVLALNEDSTILASGSDDATVRLWSIGGDEAGCLGVLEGHEGIVHSVCLDENFVYTAGADKTVRKWDIATNSCVKIFRGHKSIVNRVVSTGYFIFSSSYDRTTRCWDPDSGECVRVFVGHQRGVYPIAYVPYSQEDEAGDGQCTNKDIVITGSADHTAMAFSFETGEKLRTFKEHTGAVTCLCVDESGKVLITGSTDHSIRTWNIDTGLRLRILEGHHSSVVCLLMVNKMLFSGSSDQTARSWVIEFGDCARIYKGHEQTISCMKYKDGLLYTGSGDGSACCFGVKSGSILRQFKGHEVAVNALQVVGTKMYTGSFDKSIKIWDISGISEQAAFSLDKMKTEGAVNNKSQEDDRIDEDYDH